QKQQHIAIFTTASLPWLTGTSVNPLFRAAYLAKHEERKVTLAIPWLKRDDQEHLYPNNIIFRSPHEQESHVRHWVEQRAGFKSDFAIRFYPARFSVPKRSIIATGDLTEVIPDEEADIAVLEEPEHLTWYHHGRRWKSKFRLVIGIVHTNYLEYVKREKNGQLQAFLLKYFNNWVVDIYCHRVIRLSAATQDLPRSVICNVHGVNPKFIDIGTKRDDGAFTKGVYYIGKMLWSKGYRELIKLLGDHQRDLTGVEIDLYGSGEDSYEIGDAAKKLKMPVNIHPARDHADSLFHEYKVFINPSTTDVVCTTTAEALAMGKIVICADHPSNEFFKRFPNCRTYVDGDGFVREMLEALRDRPSPLTDEQRHDLSWDAATERFLKAAELDLVSGKQHSSSRDCSKLFLSRSFGFTRSLEDPSAIFHYLGTGLFGEQPDEEQCRELGLSV
ncbi:hypothetical protein M569_11293, partial [Genlisea aurea]